MCGIVGVIDAGRRYSEKEFLQHLTEMTNTLHHRGPDDVGTWHDPRVGVGLGHRRLSILDLSALGHQPMQSICGRYVTSFNGEIYNFKTIRAELECWGHRFHGHSDTEVMLAAISQWGLYDAVRRFNGMFAIAVWDRKEGRLHLVRDRAGEKPLYYGWIGNSFLFASELKAIRTHPGFRGTIDRKSLALFMRHNYIPAPYSIYSEIYKLLPGSMVSISPQPSVRPDLRMYWTAAEAVTQGSADPFSGTLDEAIYELDRLLKDAVRLRMEADVPLGAFLSGGIDSSTVVALMQAQSEKPVRTFSIGFHEAAYNEAHHAKLVAAHLGTAHTELYVTPSEAMDVIPRLPSLYDEPFADSSQIPTFLVSELTRRHVKVSLSGDAGDELFAGYNQYQWGLRFWNQASRIPQVVRKLMAKSLVCISPGSWEMYLNMLAPILTSRIRGRNMGHKLHVIAELLAAEYPEEMYRTIVSHWRSPDALVLGTSEPPTALTDHTRFLDLPEVLHRMMYIDMMMYLPDDILVKVDRASMAVGLEARVPFLDHRVIEFAWRLPVSMKMLEGRGKRILRGILDRYVPAKLVERPKMGFGVPIDTWLRGPLREWAEALLDAKRLRDQGFLDPEPIRQRWNEHLSGKSDWKGQIWVVLMFQAWLHHVQDDLTGVA